MWYKHSQRPIENQPVQNESNIPLKKQPTELGLNLSDEYIDKILGQMEKDRGRNFTDDERKKAKDMVRSAGARKFVEDGLKKILG